MAAAKHETATWASLPKKGQLFILCLLRFAEPGAAASSSTYIYYQLKSLDPSLTSAQIVEQSSWLRTAFMLAQCLSVLVLGTAADSPRIGRKLVLLVGMGGSVISYVMFGFIKNFKQAVLLRILEGLFNGNMAIIRTMAAEVVSESRFQSRVFALLPFSFNLAITITPVLGARLADLAGSFPARFGDSDFLREYPYAPPAIFNGCLLLTAWLAAFLFLEETLEPLRGRYDLGLALFANIRNLAQCRGYTKYKYSTIANEEDRATESMELMSDSDSSQDVPVKEAPPARPKSSARLPFRRMWTQTLCITLLSYTILECHTSAYNSLWPSFLSDPVASIEARQQYRLPFLFSGGAGMSPNEIGWTVAVLGAGGLPTQIILYPRIQQRLGTMRLLRLFLMGLPVLYAVIPYIAVLPSSTPPPSGKTGWPVWTLVMAVQIWLIICTSFVIPSHLLLLNGASPHPSARGRTHSIAILVTSLFRAGAVAIFGILYKYGSTHNCSGLAWWLAMVIAIVGYCFSWLLREGNGHEIRLEGDED